MKRLSTWLIIAGIILIMIPLAGRLYTDYRQEQLYQDYLEQSEDAQQSYEQLEETWQDLPDDAAATEPAIESGEDAGIEPGPAYEPVVLGRVKIPKIDENLLLVEGVTAKDLKLGAGHIPGTAMPGEVGNTAIAGHRNYTFGSYFNRLDELAEGDLIIVEYGKQNFTYEVYEKLVVLPEETSVINQSKTHKVLTLITCTPVRVATHRLIIHALLIE